jgi:hypothetical protein
MSQVLGQRRQIEAATRKNSAHKTACLVTAAVMFLWAVAMIVFGRGF